MANPTEILIYGASDDLVEIEGPGDFVDEFYLPYNGPWRGRFIGPDGDSLVVELTFGESDRSDWLISVVENNTTWRLDATIRKDREEDPALVIHAPAGTRLDVLTKD